MTRCDKIQRRGLVAAIGLSGVLLIPARALPDDVPLAVIRSAPDFELTDTGQATVRLNDLRGKVVLVSFVFTTCNGTCPATTHNLYRVQEALKDAGLWGDSVEFVSISLDPENDTPEVLARYAGIYGVDLAHWHFLSGSPDRIARTLGDWDMWARRNTNGVLDHPSRIFLVDPRGRIREIYNLGFLKVPEVVEDIRTILAERSREESPEEGSRRAATPGAGNGTNR